MLGRCLDRDVKNRLRDIGEARYLLSRPGKAHFEPSTHVEPIRSFRAGWLMLAAIPLLIVLFGLYRVSMEPEPAASHRFLPFATEGHGERNPVWSPDGRSPMSRASMARIRSIPVQPTWRAHSRSPSAAPSAMWSAGRATAPACTISPARRIWTHGCGRLEDPEVLPRPCFRRISRCWPRPFHRMGDAWP